MAKNFKDLSEPEIRALAISNEEADGRINADFAACLKADRPDLQRDGSRGGESSPAIDR
jgi:hypothetical protein